MPPPVHRKKPFSAKQKKRQLQEKRDRRRDGDENENAGHSRGRGRGRVRGGQRGRRGCIMSDQSREHTESSDGYGSEDMDILQVHRQPVKGESAYDPNRYRLHFLQETREEIEKRKQLARLPLQPVPECGLEMDIDAVYEPGSALDMPKRPPWNYHMSKDSLMHKEQVYFKEYLDELFRAYGERELSYMECNLETWRQLWRVIEMADVVLLITDIRHPALNFSPALYHYVTAELQKPLILVLNKIDLAPAPLVVAWRHFFQAKFPDVHIVCFTSFPKDAQAQAAHVTSVLRKKRQKKCTSTAVGPKELLKACEAIVQGKVELSSWQEKIEEDLRHDWLEDAEPADHDVNVEDLDTSFAEHERFKDGVLTIGCCGYPNVGKSSVINGLMGKKVVSVSRTPGHTKHFQTIFLTPTVKLCDCPGLVFPSLVPKPMQILAGIYPIAQVREPYTAVGYLAQRVALVDVLSLRHPDADQARPDLDDSEDREWSAMDICDAWAEKRGFRTAKAARLDTYRSANSLLRFCMEGRIVMCTRPPNYTQQKDRWENSIEAAEVTAQQTEHQHRHDDDSPDDSPDIDSGEKDEDEASSNDGDSEAGIAVNNPFALLKDDDD